MSLFRRLAELILVGLIRFYQIGISPLTLSSCRFTPTCSQYALEAIRKHGPLIGTFKTIRRILKCNPCHPGGYDPP
ncbi:membrane protein insertion efficiency factor YidD [bacterium]|nr:membrane protein insertion efficiency factor YidD [bacterium]